MDLRVFFTSLWVAVLTTGLAVGASLAYTSNAEDRFRSSGTYVIGPAAELTEPETIVRSFDSLQGQGIVPTLVELLSSRSIALGVGRPLGLDRRALEDYDVRASVLSSSNTLELSVTGPAAEQTAALARGIGAEASRVFEDLYSVYQIRELDLPVVPEDRFSPQPVRNAVLAVLLGLTVGVAVAVYRARNTSPAGRGTDAADPAPAAAAGPTPVGPPPGGPTPAAAVPHEPGRVPSEPAGSPSATAAPAGTSPSAPAPVGPAPAASVLTGSAPTRTDPRPARAGREPGRVVGATDLVEPDPDGGSDSGQAPDRAEDPPRPGGVGPGSSVGWPPARGRPLPVAGERDAPSP